MNRRAGWVLGGAAALVAVVGVTLWVSLDGGDAPPSASPSPPPASTTPAPPAPEERAQEELDELLTACAESTDRRPPEHCGIRIPWGTEFAVVTGIRYRVEALPTIVLDDASFTADGGVLVATVSGTAHDGTPRTETYRTENWSVRGDATITADEVELTIW